MSNSREQTIRQVTFVSAAVNALLALIKILVGYLGRSQALLADGLHSLADLLIDFWVIFTTKFSGQGPDHNHPYGHARIETLSSLVIALVLLVVGGAFFYNNALALWHGQATPTISLWVMVVACISIIANEGLYRYQLHHANAIHSELLKSSAWHNRSDALTSIVVLLTSVGTLIGVRWLDAVGAIIIALLIVKMSVSILYHNLQELIDHAVDEDTLKLIREKIAATAGVVAVHQLRTRLHAGKIFVDVHIQVAPMISVSEGHFISDQVQLALQKIDRISDVTVHIDPEDDEVVMHSPHLASRDQLSLYLITQKHRLPGYQDIDTLQLHYLQGQLIVDIYLPIRLLEQHNKNDLQQAYEKILNSSLNIHSVRLFFNSNS